MSGLFKDAKFGEKFRTRDGRCAIYCKCVRTPDDSLRYYLFVPDRILAEAFHGDGRWSRCNNSSIDIVSRWEELE